MFSYLQNVLTETEKNKDQNILIDISLNIEDESANFILAGNVVFSAEIALYNSVQGSAFFNNVIKEKNINYKITVG